MSPSTLASMTFLLNQLAKTAASIACMWMASSSLIVGPYLRQL